MNTIQRLLTFSVFLGLFCVSSCRSESLRVGVGEEVGRLSFVDIRYLPRSLDDFGGKDAWVLVFTDTGCPISNRYLPRLSAMEKEYRGRNVQFLGVNVGEGDSIVDMASSAIEHGVEFPMVKDWKGDVARSVGAERTPEAVILDADRRVRYRGRIDSQYRLGGVKADRGREDLREAIEDVLAGRDVRVAATEVDGCAITVNPPEPTESSTTFAEHVAPILQKRCQNCHRPDGEAPFSLTRYMDARKRAKMIAEVVKLERMPPWFADARYGKFSNDRRLTPEERRTILNWVDGGAPRGDASKEPRPLTWPKREWKITQPDLVLSVKKPIQIPADGYLPYQYSALFKDGSKMPYRFPGDTWIQEVQIRPENSTVLHHANLGYVMPKKSGTLFTRQNNFITGQVPGGGPMQLEKGTAFRIPKGAFLALQMHYVTTGREETDRISVGIVFAKHPVRKRLRHHQISDTSFKIPPGAPFHRVVARRKLEKDSTGVGMFVHMHLRGRDMRFIAHYPDGKKETLLLVPNYNFDWQLAYMFEGTKRFPAGTVIECIAHYDNTPFNPYNPDAAATVGFGPQTYHEMMYGFFFFLEDGEDLQMKVDPRTGQAESR